MYTTKILGGGLAALLLTTVAFPASATFIPQNQFANTATTYDFTGATVGSLTAGDGFLTVSGANVVSNSPGATGLSYTNNGGNGSVAGNAIRFDFSSAVSAVGFIAYYNNSPVLFEVFNSANALLDSILISPTDCGGICGFIGLQANNISYAVASLPGRPNIHNLYADNVIYQSTVPEPATLALLGLGLLGIVASQRRKQ